MKTLTYIIAALALSLGASSVATAAQMKLQPGSSELSLPGYPHASAVAGDEFYFATGYGNVYRTNLISGFTESLFTSSDPAWPNQLNVRAGTLTLVRESNHIYGTNTYTALAMNTDGTGVRTLATTKAIIIGNSWCGSSIDFAVPTTRHDEIVAISDWPIDPKHRGECPEPFGKANTATLFRTQQGSPRQTLKRNLLLGVGRGLASEWGASQDGTKIAYLSGPDGDRLDKVQYFDSVLRRSSVWRIRPKRKLFAIDVGRTGRVVVGSESLGSDFVHQLHQRISILPNFGSSRHRIPLLENTHYQYPDARFCGDMIFTWALHSPLTQSFWTARGRRLGGISYKLAHVYGCDRSSLVMQTTDRTYDNHYVVQRIDALF